MKAKFTIVIAAVYIFVSHFALVYAQAPKLINYQGQLVESGESINGTRDLTFTIYDALSGGTTLFQETHQNVSVTDGIFNVLLGGVETFPNSFFNGSGDRFLGVKVGNDAELSPRFQFASVAFALRSTHSDTAAFSLSGSTDGGSDGHSLDSAGGDSIDVVFVDNEGNVGIGTTEPAKKLDVNGNMILGTVDSARIVFDRSDVNFHLKRTLNGTQLSSGGTLTLRSNQHLEFITGGIPQARLLSNGRLGLGDQSPDAVLEVVGDLMVSQNGDGDLFIVNSEGRVGIARTTPNAMLHVSNDDGNIPTQIIRGANTQSADIVQIFENRTSAAGAHFVSAGANNVKFQLKRTSDSSVMVELQPAGTSFFNGGKVGIGTTSPTHPLEMASGAHVTAGGVWTDASSREFKENISDLTSQEALQTVSELRPMKYTYKADLSKDLHLGFIAEDVPDLVATADRRSLSPMDIVAVLTKVVQEQQKTITKMQSEIDLLMQKEN